MPGFGEDFGEVAVEVFFCLSGFLICRSLQKSPGWTRFVAARFLRIFPNARVCAGGEFGGDPRLVSQLSNLWPHVAYVADNLLMFVKGVTLVIPGVFTEAVQPGRQQSALDARPTNSGATSRSR